MKRAQIIKNGTVTNQAEMEEAELLAWVEKGTAENWFGRPAKYEEQNVLVKEAWIETIPPEVEGDESVTLDHPAEYEIQSVLIEPAEEFEVVITDITAELEQKRINQESQAFLDSTDWLIIRELDEGTPCPIEIKQARAIARAKIIK